MLQAKDQNEDLDYNDSEETSNLKTAATTATKATVTTITSRTTVRIKQQQETEDSVAY